jgi:hypothetical protein
MNLHYCVSMKLFLSARKNNKRINFYGLAAKNCLPNIKIEFEKKLSFAQLCI